MQKNKNVKNVKEYVKKVNINIYIKNYKLISNRNIKPNQTKKEYIKATNIQKCV